MANEKIRCKVTDTKQEILKQYKGHLDDINSRSATVVPTTSQLAEKAATTKAIDTAATVDASTVEELAVKLNRSLSDTLLGIGQKITEEKARFDQIALAIEAKKAELAEVLEIEVQANTLAALIAAQTSSREETNVEIEEILAAAQSEADEILKAANDAAATIRTQIATMQAEEAQRRKRGEEEYQYNFNRSKMQQENALKDALALQSKSLDAREASVKERELLQSEKDEYLAKVVAELEALKASVDAKIADAVAKTTKDANTSAAISANIVNSKHQSELTIKDNENKSLQAQVAELRSRVEQTQEALQAANKQVQEIAMQALTAKAEASRPLVVNGSDSNGKR